MSFVAISDCPRVKKPHNVAEDLILPAARAVIQAALCDEAAGGKLIYCYSLTKQ